MSTILSTVVLITILFTVTSARTVEYCTEYESQWKKELIANGLEHVFTTFYENQLFSTPFLLYLNEDGISKIGEELGMNLSEMDKFKINTIAWKIHYQQQQIDQVGIHYEDDHKTKGQRKKESNDNEVRDDIDLSEIRIAGLRNPII